MRNILYLFFALSIVSLSFGCGDDDDDGGPNSGTGGGNDDLVMTLTWEEATADFDLSMIAPNSGVAGGGFSFNTPADSSGDDLTGPGEETITFDDNAPDGTYNVVVNLASGPDNTPFTLRIQSRSDGRTFNETRSTSDNEFAVAFTKDGRQLNF